MMRTYGISVLLLLVLSPFGGALPSQFTIRDAIPENHVTDFDFAPIGGGKYVMFLAKKDGQVMVIENPDDSAQERKVLDLREKVCDNSERGLEGIAVHPKFKDGGNKRKIYLFYTYDIDGDQRCAESEVNGPVNRFSRFDVDDDYNLKNEKVLFRTPRLLFDHHNSGDIEFGKDGYVYVTVGDAGDAKSRVSQNKGTLLGKFIRLKDDGEVPGGNPYVGDSNAVSCAKTGQAPDGKVCEEVFAYGLRNPFRFALDPESEDTRFFINDVGGAHWEEVNEAGKGFKGKNYGYPPWEGPCQRKTFKGCEAESPYEMPTYWYKHVDGKGAITGGAFVPKEANWPSEYNRAYIYAEYVFGELNIIWPDRSKECSVKDGCDPPKSGWRREKFHNIERPVNLKFGPYKGGMALYVSGFRNDHIQRITYDGDNSSNRDPSASFEVSSSSVAVGERVEFDASSSSDRDDDSLSFEWNFDDGSSKKSGKTVTHRFDESGVYNVRLTVDDGEGGEDSTRMEISVGAKPVVEILSPSNSLKFKVGDRIFLEAEGMTANGDTLPDSAFAWEVLQRHDDHFHPFLSRTEDNKFRLQKAPEPEDFLAATNSYLEVIVTATDPETGLSSTVSRDVMPEEVTIRFDTNIKGSRIRLQGFQVELPTEVVSWVNHPLTLDAFPQDKLKFSQWSIGGSAQQVYTVPDQRVQQIDVEFEEDPNSVGETGGDGDETGSDFPLVLLAGGDELLPSEEITYPGIAGLRLFQMNNGRILLRYNSQVLWSSPFKGENGEKYFSKLQGDGNFLTKLGTPDDKGQTQWKTGGAFPDPGPFHLVLNMDATIAVVGGSPRQPNNVIWTDGTTSLDDLIEAVGGGPTGGDGGTPPRPDGYPVVLLEQGETLATTAVFEKRFEGIGLLEQTRSGRLRLHLNGEGIVWESGFGEAGESDYYSKVQNDGNFLTRSGSPGNKISTVWRTGWDEEASETGSFNDPYKFVLLDGTKVAVIDKNGMASWVAELEL